MNTIQSEFKRLGVNKSSKEAKETQDQKHLSKPKYSRREIEDLMGIRRDTYVRNNGAIRRK